QMVEQLRVILNVALNKEWQGLMENRQSGAMSGVYYLYEQIEDALLASSAPPANREPLLIRLPHQAPGAGSGRGHSRAGQAEDAVEQPVVDEGITGHQDDESQVNQERLDQTHIQPPGDQRDQVDHQGQLEADRMRHPPRHTAS